MSSQPPPPPPSGSPAPAGLSWTAAAAVVAGAAAATVAGVWAYARSRSQKPRYSHAPPGEEEKEAELEAEAAEPAADAAAEADREAGGSVRELEWGHTPYGAPVRSFVLRSASGAEATVCELGATLVGLTARGRDGAFADVALGFDRLEQYVAEHPYLGATCGRVANRIAGGRFRLPGDAREHQVTRNWNGRHALHGGRRGFSGAVWRGRRAGPSSVEFSRVSRDGEEGFPGELAAAVTYTMLSTGALEVRMTARAGAATLCNMAHHTYWNLAGHGAGSVAAHRLRVFATAYTPCDAEQIPTGEVAPVGGTPLDFTSWRRVGDALDALAGCEATGGGLDHNYVLAGAALGAEERSAAGSRAGGEPLLLAAQLHDPESGRTLALYTDQPALQVYSAGWFDGTLLGKGGALYDRFGGLALETQLPPDAVHHPNFASAVLSPEEEYSHTMLFRFGVDDAGDA